MEEMWQMWRIFKLETFLRVWLDLVIFFVRIWCFSILMYPLHILLRFLPPANLVSFWVYHNYILTRKTLSSADLQFKETPWPELRNTALIDLSSLFILQNNRLPIGRSMNIFGIYLWFMEERWGKKINECNQNYESQLSLNTVWSVQESTLSE